MRISGQQQLQLAFGGDPGGSDDEKLGCASRSGTATSPLARLQGSAQSWHIGPGRRPLFQADGQPDGSAVSYSWRWDRTIIPNAGISLSNGVFLVCNSGSNASLPSPQTNDFSVLVAFNETNLPLTSSGSFTSNRATSMLNTNLDPRSPLQGHFIQVAMHEYGTNVLMFGTGEFRSGDIFLCMTPTASFVSGAGTLYFTGLTDGQPTWSSAESNCVPVVQDNPTNGPPWPNDFATAGSVSVIYLPGGLLHQLADRLDGLHQHHHLDQRHLQFYRQRDQQRRLWQCQVLPASNNKLMK